MVVKYAMNIAFELYVLYIYCDVVSCVLIVILGVVSVIFKGYTEKFGMI